MFNDSLFEKWLDDKAKELISKLGDGKSLSSQEMMILVLKAQTNHFAHLDQDLRGDIKSFQTNVDKKFETMDEKFLAIDKRFVAVDKRFERIYTFMRWQIGLIAGGFAALFIKLMIG